jgi:hypothetical protein
MLGNTESWTTNPSADAHRSCGLAKGRMSCFRVVSSSGVLRRDERVFRGWDGFSSRALWSLGLNLISLPRDRRAGRCTFISADDSKGGGHGPPYGSVVTNADERWR